MLLSISLNPEPFEIQSPRAQLPQGFLQEEFHQGLGTRYRVHCQITCMMSTGRGPGQPGAWVRGYSLENQLTDSLSSPTSRGNTKLRATSRRWVSQIQE